MVTTPTTGQANWDVPLNAALNDLQNQINLIPTGIDWLPSDQTLIAWPYDVALASGNTILTTGNLNLIRVKTRTTQTINSIIISITTAGSGLTAGQNFAALYDSAGTRVAITADQSAVWNSTGVKTMALTAPYVAPAGEYLIALLTNGTTAPTIHRSTSSTTGSINVGTATSTLRFASQGAALTAPPASFSPATMTTSNVAWWSGLK